MTPNRRGCAGNRSPSSHCSRQGPGEEGHVPLLPSALTRTGVHTHTHISTRVLAHTSHPRSATRAPTYDTAHIPGRPSQRCRPSPEHVAQGTLMKAQGWARFWVHPGACREEGGAREGLFLQTWWEWSA